MFVYKSEKIYINRLFSGMIRVSMSSFKTMNKKLKIRPVCYKLEIITPAPKIHPPNSTKDLRKRDPTFLNIISTHFF